MRGIGVALIISRCGSRSPWSCSFSRNASRWATPKRCCSSMMARPSLAKRTCSSITACVPMTSPASPDATCASIASRCLPFLLPVSQATVTPSGASQPTSFLRCCSARISVGAISAHCQPASIARAAASAATTVLPEPTSPCSRRCIGTSRPRSASISAATRCCAAVSANGSASSRASCRRPRAAPSGGARWRSRSRLASSCDSCCASSSSNLSRCHAGCSRSSSAAASSPGRGSCRCASAARKVGRPSGTIPAGRCSSRSARARPAATALRRYACDSCTVLG